MKNLGDFLIILSLCLLFPSKWNLEFFLRHEGEEVDKWSFVKEHSSLTNKTSYDQIRVEMINFVVKVKSQKTN